MKIASTLFSLVSLEGDGGAVISVCGRAKEVGGDLPVRREGRGGRHSPPVD